MEQEAAAELMESEEEALAREIQDASFVPMPRSTGLDRNSIFKKGT